MRTTEVPTVRTACVTKDGAECSGLRAEGGESNSRNGGDDNVLSTPGGAATVLLSDGAAGCTSEGGGGGGAENLAGDAGLANGLKTLAKTCSALVSALLTGPAVGTTLA